MGRRPNRHVSEEDMEIGTYKEAHHGSPLKKRKSELRGIALHRLKWPSLKSLQITNAGEGVG